MLMNALCEHMAVTCMRYVMILKGIILAHVRMASMGMDPTVEVSSFYVQNLLNTCVRP